MAMIATLTMKISLPDSTYREIPEQDLQWVRKLVKAFLNRQEDRLGIAFTQARHKHKLPERLGWLITQDTS